MINPVFSVRPASTREKFRRNSHPWTFRGIFPRGIRLMLFLTVAGLVGFLPLLGKAEEPRLKVATVKFAVQGRLDIPDAGSIVANWLTAALVQGGVYDVKERLSLDQILAEQTIGQTGLIDAETAARVGHLYGVKAIITGSVTRLDPSLPIYVSVRMIDTETGTILKYLQATSENLRNLEPTVRRLADQLAADIRPPGVVPPGPLVSPPSHVEEKAAEDQDRKSWSLRELFRPQPAPESAPSLREIEPVVSDPIAESVHTGVLLVTSSPSDARVYVMDRSKRWLAPYGDHPDWLLLGSTPYHNPSMPVGNYWIRVALGNKQDIHAVRIEPGKTVRKRISFQRIGEGGLGDVGGP